MIIDINTLKVVGEYNSASPAQKSFTGKHGNKKKTMHVVAPEDYEIKKVVEGTQSTHDFEHQGVYYSFVIDSEKQDKLLKKIRKDKIRGIREERDQMLLIADNGINKHFDNDPKAKKTLDEWKAYRIALRDITDEYKNFDTDPAHAAILDALDLENFVWPEKP